MTSVETKVADLYPEIEPFDSGFLQVSDRHRVYYEQCGQATGRPVLYVHGGPGAGTSPRDRRFFDPKVYRVVLFDQRGAGRSTPPAELKENNTWALVEDMEKLRIHLGIDDWVLFGGSWGSCLILAYAQTHPERVRAIIIRGIFTLRRKELIWYYQEGASYIYPDEYEKYVAPIPEVERPDLMSAYYRRLTGDNVTEQLRCARVWSSWEMATSRLIQDPALLKKTDSDQWCLQFAKIECHYFVNGGFFESEGQLLNGVDKIRHIPCTIVQGRYDVVCPMYTAWDLHREWPEAEFHIVPDGGHSNKEPGTLPLLMSACEKYKLL